MSCHLKPKIKLLTYKNAIKAMVLTIVICLPLIVPSYVTHILILICFWAFLGEAWNLLGGYAGQFSLCNGAFVGIGAYTSTILFLYLDITPWIGMFVGGIFATLLGLAIGYLCFRLKGPYFVVITIALNGIVVIMFKNLKVITRGALGLFIPMKFSLINFQFLSNIPYYYIILSFLAATIYVTYKIEKTHLGYYIRALRDSEEAAESIGIDVLICKLKVMAISSFFTAIGGTFYAQFMLYIYPEAFGVVMSVDIILPPIIGGSGTVLGPVLGASIMEPISELLLISLGGLYKGAHLIIYGIILIATLFFQPKGVIEIVRRFIRRNARAPKMRGNRKKLRGGREG